VTIPVGVSFTTDAYAGRALALSVAPWHFDRDGRRVESPTYAMGTPSVSRSWQCEKIWDVAFTAPAEAACGCVCLTLTADGRQIAKNFWSFGVTNAAPKTVAASKSEWSGGTTNVLGGLKLNGFGKGFFEFDLPVLNSNNQTIKQSNNSLVFRAELSSKRKNAKDLAEKDKKGGLDYMLGGGSFDRSKNPNSYPQTSDEKLPSNLKVYVNGKLARELVLPDDPADHRGILSWLSQPHDGKLREAGSYGYLVEAPVPAEAVKDGKVTVRLEADNGLAVYGPAFGRYALGPHVAPAK